MCFLKSTLYFYFDFFYLAFLINWWPSLLVVILPISWYSRVFCSVKVNILMSKKVQMWGCIVAYDTQVRKMHSITKQFFKYRKIYVKNANFFSLCAKMPQMLLVGNSSAIFYKEKNFEPNQNKLFSTKLHRWSNFDFKKEQKSNDLLETIFFCIFSFSENVSSRKIVLFPVRKRKQYSKSKTKFLFFFNSSKKLCFAPCYYFLVTR